MIRFLAHIAEQRPVTEESGVHKLKVDKPTGGKDPHRALRRRRYETSAGAALAASWSKVTIS
jgi:hypothetical protein